MGKWRRCGEEAAERAEAQWGLSNRALCIEEMPGIPKTGKEEGVPVCGKDSLFICCQ